MLILARQEGIGITYWLKQTLGGGAVLDPLWLLVGCLLPVLTWITIFGLFAIWLERKVSAHMQCRLGPMEVGGWHGWAQTIADGVKLLAKEDVIPKATDKILFIIAPIIAFAATFATFLVLPWGPQVGNLKLIVADIPLGVFYIAAVGSLEGIGVILAGWSSNNKWSLFGAMRTATQLVSYEIPLGVCLITVVVVTGSFSLLEISELQAGWFWNWYMFRNPFLFVTFLILFVCNLAETKRSPFDLPEAESELVSGFHTEYSGMRFSIFFLAEYASMYAVSALAAALFMGGWHTGIAPLDAAVEGTLVGAVLGLVVMLSKGIGLVFVQMWLRWTLPRVRLDQVMYLCLKVLLPFSMVCLLGAALWEMYVDEKSWWFAMPFGLAVAGGGALLFARLGAMFVQSRRYQYDYV